MTVNQRRAGAVLSYVSLVVNAVASLVYVPLLLGFLTTSEYGVYELIGSVIAYLSVMDMGLSTTLSRFYVSSKVTEDERATENLLAMAAIIYGVLTLLAVFAGVAMNFAIDPVFGRSFALDELELAHQMMLLVILNCVVVLPGNWFLALIQANERFVFARVISIAKYLLQVFCVLAVLNWRSNALFVLAVQVLLNALVVMGYVAYCRCRLCVRARLHRWDWRLAGSLFSFSFFILLNMVFDQVFWKTGQVVLGAVSGSAAVAVYGIACKLITSAYMQISTGVSSVFLPKLTSISARTDDMAEINVLFKKIGRIQAMLVWGVCGAFVVLGEDFICLWAGPGFEGAYPATVTLMLGLSVSLVQNLGISILQAKNKMGFRSVVYIVLAVVYVIVAIPISARFGVVGCAAAAAMLLFVGTGPVINMYYKRVIGIDVTGFFGQVAPLTLPVIGASIVTYLFVGGVANGYSWVGFFAGCILFVVSYGVFLLFFLNDYEKGLVAAAARKMCGALSPRKAGK